MTGFLGHEKEWRYSFKILSLTKKISETSKIIKIRKV
jgi:hypothetical protein